jgi:chromosomal replication initiator protein
MAAPGITDMSNFSTITNTVCGIYKTNISQISLRTRKRAIVWPRHVCMTLCKLKTKSSLSEIGNYYGKYDHATVLHAMKTVKNLIDTDKGIREDIGHLFMGVNWPTTWK